MGRYNLFYLGLFVSVLLLRAVPSIAQEDEQANTEDAEETSIVSEQIGSCNILPNFQCTCNNLAAGSEGWAQGWLNRQTKCASVIIEDSSLEKPIQWWIDLLPDNEVLKFDVEYILRRVTLKDWNLEFEVTKLIDAKFEDGADSLKVTFYTKALHLEDVTFQDVTNWSAWLEGTLTKNAFNLTLNNISSNAFGTGKSAKIDSPSDRVEIRILNSEIPSWSDLATFLSQSPSTYLTIANVRCKKDGDDTLSLASSKALFNRLERLQISGCGLEKFEFPIDPNNPFLNIKYLNLSNNNLNLDLKNLPELGGLEVLDLSNNQIGMLNFDDLKGFAKLSFIDICSNQIARLDLSGLASVPNLQVLDLSKNRIEEILPPQATDQLSSMLCMLDLDNNLLGGSKSLPNAVLDALSQTFTKTSKACLNTWTRIRKIYPKLVGESFKKAPFLRFSENEWSCKCSTWNQSRAVVDTIKAICDLYSKNDPQCVSQRMPKCKEPFDLSNKTLEQFLSETNITELCKIPETTTSATTHRGPSAAEVKENLTTPAPFMKAEVMVIIIGALLFLFLVLLLAILVVGCLRKHPREGAEDGAGHGDHERVPTDEQELGNSHARNQNLKFVAQNNQGNEKPRQMQVQMQGEGNGKAYEQV